ncbi:MAG: cupin domain-containing protein [Bacteroidota bacterium]
MERKIYNPVQKDYVTFIETHTDTNGKRTLVEVELAAGGGVGLHYHKTYSEKFTVIEGELSVQLGKKIHVLKKGETATALPNINHRFFNATKQITKFICELNPGSKGFEMALQIGYGLARDGQTDKKGFPKDKYALAWLFSISESNLPGLLSLIEPVLRKRARKAIEKGMDKELTGRYVKF